MKGIIILISFSLVFCLINASLIKLKISEIKLRDNLNKIKKALQESKFKHHAYKEIAYLVDTFGPRLYGSKSLELALNHMENLLKNSKFKRVQQEEIPNIPVWVRGKERFTLYSPRLVPSPIPLIGLGNSVSCNVRAEVIVLSSFEELKAKNDKVKGKIVLFNTPWTNYEDGIEIRLWGAVKAAKYGAVAMLMRSITSRSIESPHIGVMK